MRSRAGSNRPSSHKDVSFFPHLAVSSGFAKGCKSDVIESTVDIPRAKKLRSRIKNLILNSLHFYIEGGSDPSFTSCASSFKVIYFYYCKAKEIAESPGCWGRKMGWEGSGYDLPGYRLLCMPACRKDLTGVLTYGVFLLARWVPLTSQKFI
jgi:hypothetical protein